MKSVKQKFNSTARSLELVKAKSKMLIVFQGEMECSQRYLFEYPAPVPAGNKRDLECSILRQLAQFSISKEFIYLVHRSAFPPISEQSPSDPERGQLATGTNVVNQNKSALVSDEMKIYIHYRASVDYSRFSFRSTDPAEKLHRLYRALNHIDVIVRKDSSVF